MLTFGLRAVPSSLKATARALGLDERDVRREFRWWASRVGIDHYEFWTPHGYIVPYGFWINLVEEVNGMKFGKPKLLKKVDKWVEILANVEPERIAEMAIETYRYERWDGNGWEVAGYQLLLQNSEVEKVSVDTTGSLEIVYRGNFATIPLDAYEHRLAKQAYHNLAALKETLDRRYGA